MRIHINLNGAKQKLSAKSIEQGRKIMANQALADMNNFVPFRDGFLRNNSTIDTDGSAINYNMPYAKAQFLGRVGKGLYPVRRYTTPGTGPRWDEKAKGLYMDSWERAFVKGANW